MSDTRKNHFVPRLYLKQFSNAKNDIFKYSLFAAHENQRLWDPRNYQTEGYRFNLYTRTVNGIESGDIDTWLNEEFEQSAVKALARVANNENLKSEDWEVLVNFLACQIVRTPAFYQRMLPVWRDSMPQVLDTVAAEAKRELVRARAIGQSLKMPEIPDHMKDLKFPLRIQRRDLPAEDLAEFNVETLAGRDLWIWSMRHLLTESDSIKALRSHHWSILHSHIELPFFTSDDPVVRLRTGGLGQYHLDGGWGNSGTHIFLPLTPRHLLHTEVGHRYAARGLLLTEAETQRFCVMIAKNAHRHIFAMSPRPEVERIRPRTVSREIVQRENDEWTHWHEAQNEAMANIIDGSDPQQKP